jgi:cytochrome c oxidase subunit II
VGQGEKEKERLNGLFNIPAPASKVAGQVDSVFLFILAVGLFFFVITQGTLIYFALRYRKRKGDPDDPETPQIRGNVVLEGVWILIPTILIFAIFAYGYVVFMRMEKPLAGATEINVVAKQWLWEFEYPDGRKAINELRMAVGEPVDLVMTSEDVIHSLFIPEFRMKQDILPGRYTHMYLQPAKAGEYQIFCAEYCGEGHSKMLAKLIVMQPAAYHEWQEKQEEKSGGAPSSERGEHLLESSGCLACHTLDGTVKVGPSLKGLFGSRVALADGSTVTADEDYIRESILDPNAKVVKGFQPVMPTFKGALSGSDITSIIDYLKKLGAGGNGAGGKKPPEKAVKKPEAAGSGHAGKGAKLVEGAGCLGCHSTDGSPKFGPTFKGLYGSTVALSGGRSVKADDAYIKESVLEPGAKVVKGYPPAMPSFKGKFSDEELDEIVEYIGSFKR